MMKLFTWLGLVEPPPPPDPLDRIAHAVEASAWQQSSDIATMRGQLAEMNRAMHSYHAAIVALQAENKQLGHRITDLEDDVAEMRRWRAT